MLLLFTLLSWGFLKLPMVRSCSLRRPWQTCPFALEGRGPWHRSGLAAVSVPTKCFRSPRAGVEAKAWGS